MFGSESSGSLNALRAVEYDRDAGVGGNVENASACCCRLMQSSVAVVKVNVSMMRQEWNGFVLSVIMTNASSTITVDDKATLDNGVYFLSRHKLHD